MEDSPDISLDSLKAAMKAAGFMAEEVDISDIIGPRPSSIVDSSIKLILMREWEGLSKLMKPLVNEPLQDGEIIVVRSAFIHDGEMPWKYEAAVVLNDVGECVLVKLRGGCRHIIPRQAIVCKAFREFPAEEGDDCGPEPSRN